MVGVVFSPLLIEATRAFFSSVFLYVNIAGGNTVYTIAKCIYDVNWTEQHPASYRISLYLIGSVVY